jgi:hypothetical protein
LIKRTPTGRAAIHVAEMGFISAIAETPAGIHGAGGVSMTDPQVHPGDERGTSPAMHEHHGGTLLAGLGGCESVVGKTRVGLPLQSDRATAILTYDTYAGELIRQLANRGLSVPRDISIMGFDDDIHGWFCPMTLATYRQDIDAMATEAVNLVRERIKNPDRAPRMVKVEGKVIVRDSLGPAPVAS